VQPFQPSSEGEARTRGAPLALLALAAWLCACGSERLQTAVEPALGGGGVASAGASGSPALGGNYGAGGAPAPTQTDVLVGLADFPASYVYGPLDAAPFDVPDVTFQRAWRAAMTQAPTTEWDAQLLVPLTHAVSRGDLLNVSFWVRCEASGDNGQCKTDFIFERDGDPWEKSVAFGVLSVPSAGWQQQSEFFTVIDDYVAGQAHMLFRLGYANQVIDIGGLVVERIVK